MLAGGHTYPRGQGHVSSRCRYHASCTLRPLPLPVPIAALCSTSNRVQVEAHTTDVGGNVVSPFFRTTATVLGGRIIWNMCGIFVCSTMYTLKGCCYFFTHPLESKIKIGKCVIFLLLWLVAWGSTVCSSVFASLTPKARFFWMNIVHAPRWLFASPARARHIQTIHTSDRWWSTNCL